MTESPSLPSSNLPLVLAPDAQADAAVLEADAMSLGYDGDGGDEGDEGRVDDLGEPDYRLEARNTPELTREDRETLEQALDAVELDDMTAQEVAELESGDAARMAAVLRVKEQPQASSSATRSGEDDGSSLNRVSIKALPPPLRLKLVNAISRARDGGDFETALRETFSWQGEAGAPGHEQAQNEYQHLPSAAQAMPGPGPGTVMPQVAEVEDRLAGMRAEYERAKAEYDPRAQDLLEAMMDVKLDLREAQRGQAVFMQGQRSSYERVVAEHGDLMGDAESTFMDLCDMTISLAERNNDPILWQPDWPERIAKQVRGKFFRGAGAHSAASPGGRPQFQVPMAVPRAPQQRVRLPGSPVGNGFAPGSLTPETALAEFDQLTPDEQEAALTEIAKATDGRRR